MIGIKISVEGVAKIVASLNKNMDNKTDAKIAKLAKIIANNISRNAPKKTGALAKSIKSRKAGLMHYEVTEGVFYGVIQRSGTTKKGYPIYPRNKMALWWPGLPYPVAYVKSHPGFKANDYVNRGVEQSGTDIERTRVDIGNDYILVTKKA